MQKIDKEKVCDFVCKHFNISMLDITRKSRKRDLVIPRQIIATIIHLNGHSQASTGETIERNHATVLHSLNAIKNMLNPKFKNSESTIVKQCLLLFKNRYPYTNLSELPGEWGHTPIRISGGYPRVRKVYYVLPSVQWKRKGFGTSKRNALQSKVGPLNHNLRLTEWK